MLDTKGNIASWNLGAQVNKGYTADEIVGRHFSAFYPQEKIDEGWPETELLHALRDGRFEDEGWRVRKDGSRFWASVVITAVFDEHGEHRGFAKVTRDLTERREMQLRAIDDARRIAEVDAANRTKSEFLAAMSHELRTPLNAISGYADLLATGIGGELSPQQQQFVSRIHGSQQHLLGIINDILNFSRIEAGQITYEVAPLSLRSVIETVIPFVEPQATSKSLNVTGPTGDDDLVALADRTKVEQILINLLSNSVKFTEEGGHIEIVMERSGDRVLIHVRDDGVGIAADEIPRIFEPFVQVGRSLTSAQQGAGLGLAISRDLARGMEGDLEAQSEPGHGATFTLSLPAA
jgi:PAS domain S-box-containing protein